jgi:hypothetical protein
LPYNIVQKLDEHDGGEVIKVFEEMKLNEFLACGQQV